MRHCYAHHCVVVPTVGDLDLEERFPALQEPFWVNILESHTQTLKYSLLYMFTACATVAGDRWLQES